MRIPTVLFVDDEPLVTASLKRMLRKEPWRILEAHSGAEALALLGREAIDVVVSDEAMPVMSGSEFLTEVRRRHPETVRMILSGHSNLDTAVKAINEGQVYRFLIKPCSEADLRFGIGEALRLRVREKDRLALGSTVEAQSEELRDLEKRNPGILEVRRGDDGAILIDDEDRAA